MSNAERMIDPTEAKTPDDWFCYVIQRAKAAEDWYAARIRKKRWKAILFLFLTIALTGAAGLLPVLLEIGKDGTGKYLFSPAYASALLGLSAILLAWDRIGDLTGGWIRFIRTKQEIESLKEGFLLDWAVKKSLTPPPSDSDLIILSKTFLLGVLGIVSKETSEWAAAFQSALTELAKAAKEEVQIKKPGAINVAVTNGDQTTAGWDLTINGAEKKHHVGKHAVVSGLAPGVHVIRVEGQIGGVLKAAESAVIVSAGAVADKSFTLV